MKPDILTLQRHRGSEACLDCCIIANSPRRKDLWAGSPKVTPVGDMSRSSKALSPGTHRSKRIYGGEDVNTIDQKASQIGARAAELLLEQIEATRPLRPGKIFFVSTLVPRKSTQRTFDNSPTSAR
jgi:hypothetical protein